MAHIISFGPLHLGSCKSAAAGADIFTSFEGERERLVSVDMPPTQSNKDVIINTSFTEKLPEKERVCEGEGEKGVCGLW